MATSLKKMPDNPELVDEFEDNLFKIIRQALKDGIDPETIRFLLQNERGNMKLIAYSGEYLGRYAPEKPEKGHE